MKNRFLNWIYNSNKDYDSLERESRHGLVIHIFILILVVCGLLPLILNITHQVDVVNSSTLMSVLCAIMLALFRIPYLAGKLNQYGK